MVFGRVFYTTYGGNILKTGVFQHPVKWIIGDLMKVLVTGANGFVGQTLCRKLIEQGYSVRGAVRNGLVVLPLGVDKSVVGSIGESSVWSDALRGIDVVIHLAARVHVMEERSLDPLSEFRMVNVVGTMRLATAAIESGVRRLVYVSTVKVNGEETADTPFSEGDTPNPQDPYAISKWEAEEVLRKISNESGLEIAILRPPLVYGPGVGGNFIRMLYWIKKGFPLPLGLVKNRRSMVYVENLADALMACAFHPKAANETFLVSDRETVATPELIRMLSKQMGGRPAIFPFPLPLLHWAGRLAGKSDELKRLTESLEIDSGKIRERLGWQPPYDISEGLARTVRWFNED